MSVRVLFPNAPRQEASVFPAETSWSDTDSSCSRSRCLCLSRFVLDRYGITETSPILKLRRQIDDWQITAAAPRLPSLRLQQMWNKTSCSVCDSTKLRAAAEEQTPTNLRCFRASTTTAQLTWDASMRRSVGIQSFKYNVNNS